MIGYKIKDNLADVYYLRGHFTKGKVYYTEENGLILTNNRQVSISIIDFDAIYLKNKIGGKLL